METIAAILFFSQFVLAAVAVGLSVALFRHHRQFGWLLLAAAFCSPFVSILLRWMHGMPLLTYYQYGPQVNGVQTVIINWRIPGFYLLVVAGLVLLLRGARQSAQVQEGASGQPESTKSAV